ncbi:MAG: gliding motility-associated C-terminal domain-containing protein [Bacteroidetes bacterium]|nr:gliding motility-associated C-terminal domain-containing protein [Bacteroidota bacterium]
MATDEGCASISNSVGQLLFYTDGRIIWNKNHTKMSLADGTSWNKMLSGDESSTQSALITPFIGDTNKYFVFTTDGASSFPNVGPQGKWDGLYYTVVNMNLNGGFGDIDTSFLSTQCNYISGSNKIQLLDSVDEKVTAAIHSNGHDYWIITQHQPTSNIYAFHVSCQVSCTPVVSGFGVGCAPGNGAISASKDGKSILIANAGTLPCASYRGAHIVDFNNQTGAASNMRVLLPNVSCYGASFSPDDSKIYFTQYTGTYTLHGFDRFATNIATSINSVVLPFQPGLIQEASNGKLYIAERNSGTISELSSPNNYLSPGLFVNAIALAGKQSKLGLPNTYNRFFVSAINYNYTISDTSICAGDSISIGVATASSNNTYSWSPTSGLSNSAIANPKASPNASTLYVLSIYLPCDTLYDTLQVNVNPKPIVNLGNDTSFCNGNTVVINVQSPTSSYWWSTGDTLGAIVVSTSGIYSSTVTNQFGCSNSDSIDIVVNPLPILLINSVAICNGNTATLTAAGALAYSWSNGASSSVILVAPSISTTYTLTGTDSNGCISDTTASVVVNPLPTPFIISVHEICIGGTISMSVSGNYNITWFNGSTSNVVSSMPASTTTYSLLATDSNGCTATAVKTILVNQLPVVSFQALNVCQGSYATINGVGASSYSWITPNNVFSGNVFQLQIDSSTLVTVIGTDTNNCVNTYSQTISPMTKPIADFDIIVIDSLCSFSSLVINHSINEYFNKWYLNAEPISFDRNLTLSLPSIGSYSLTLIVESGLGCLDTTQKQIEVKEDFISTLYIPNCFTPNGDGVNDTWGVEYTCMKELKCEIYNRWGENIKTLTSLSERWDGQYNGGMAESEVFVYKIITTDNAKENKQAKVGYVTVLR